MNREEAQFILGAYRPDTVDALDPQFKEALALARQDPVLAQWLAEEQALDRAFAAKLRARPVPAELKAQLLLARATFRRRRWWQQPAWLAAAAVFAVLLSVSAVMFRTPAGADELARFRTAMAAVATDEDDHFDKAGLDVAGYKKWLAAHRGHPDFILPPGLADKGISACKVIEWDRHPVTMLCFKVSGQHLDIFVVKAADFPGLKLDATPVYLATAELTTATWLRDGKVYLLAGSMSAAELKNFL
jgi:uncharacterized membrane protein YbaN (DUF454 family)